MYRTRQRAGNTVDYIAGVAGEGIGNVVGTVVRVSKDSVVGEVGPSAITRAKEPDWMPGKH